MEQRGLPKVKLMSVTQVCCLALGGLVGGTLAAGTEPINITQIRLEAGRVEVAWEGGAPPYQVETATALPETDWEILASQVFEQVYALAAVGNQGFIRVSCVEPVVASLPFGCDLDADDSCPGPKPSPWCLTVPPIGDWREPIAASETPPLQFDFWSGPYQNKAGFDAVERINGWFTAGESAGLSQDAFRSFDSDHSTIRDFYPQLQRLDAVDSYESDCRVIYEPGLTFGVQSLSVDAGSFGSGISVIDFHHLTEVVQHYHPAGARTLTPTGRPAFRLDFYRRLFENNMLLVSPAVNSYRETDGGVDDRFQFLTPYSLASVGASGTDSRLLKPVIFAAASLPRGLKTRMLRLGLQVPVLSWLWKSGQGGGLRSEAAHRAAYALPSEAVEPPPTPATLPDGSMESRLDSYRNAPDAVAPFLIGLLERAHGLSHLPPVARLGFEAAPAVTGESYAVEPFVRFDPYSVQAVVRPGEQLVLELDLSQSWTDQRSLAGYHAQVLREPDGTSGAATQLDLDETSGRVTLTVPWQTAASRGSRRTDIVFLVNDGEYDSVPAYVSVRHLQEDEREEYNF